MNSRSAAGPAFHRAFTGLPDLRVLESRAPAASETRSLPDAASAPHSPHHLPVRTSAPAAIALWTVALVLVQASLTGLSASSAAAVVPGALVAVAAA